MKYLFTFSIICLLISCKENSTKIDPNFQDLMKYGIPYSLRAPDDVKINKLGSGQLVDLSLKNDQGFDVQIFMSPAISNDLIKLKANKKNEIRANPFFVKIIEEFEDGFLYEKRNDIGDKNYDFIIIKIVGNNEIVFQCGNSKEFSEKEVKTMISSVLKK